ncbi:MAG: hypothetical protein GY820_38470 [Gammaproteobacteria bacterium]|nr:hypothetical protein [Gammaproteobacteria bacterium]
MKTLHLSIGKTFDESANGIQVIGFKLDLPEGVEYVSDDSSAGIFNSVIVGMVPDEPVLSIGAQNAGDPILVSGEICSIGFDVGVDSWEPVVYDIFAKDRNGDDVVLDIELEALLVFRWTISGVWT